jgi:hypothetical protein
MFRFTIRDVLWLTVVVALGVGWWVERASVFTERGQLRSEREWLKAKRRELNTQFLILTDTADRLNNPQAQAAKSNP